MDEYTFEVPDMTCEGCETIVTGEVSGLPGVSRIEADATTGRVRIQGDPTAKGRVRETIEAVGYEVRE